MTPGSADHPDKRLRSPADFISEELSAADFRFREVILGRRAASPADVRALEQRIGRRLPPGYRRFLELVDGWPHVGPEGASMFRAAEVDRLAEHHPSLPDRVVSDLVRVTGTDFVALDYMTTPPGLVHIGGADDVYALNPSVRNAWGDWEAWLLPADEPAAIRFGGFWDLLLHLLRHN